MTYTFVTNLHRFSLCPNYCCFCTDKSNPEHCVIDWRSDKNLSFHQAQCWKLIYLVLEYCYKPGKSLPSNVSLMVGKRVLQGHLQLGTFLRGKNEEKKFTPQTQREKNQYLPYPESSCQRVLSLSATERLVFYYPRPTPRGFALAPKTSALPVAK
ncbi:hypothetical protein AVEN_112086-1 [Araneus ventricosus]|uniref:Uncharacterized protein n=1 Tax=Araneus ventricosus TaxID=182803 RepID=A0A4Y2NZ49_ARAVE|nr:hypothetical protein AVEN_112086-1 [Araneus ventricosus]